MFTIKATRLSVIIVGLFCLQYAVAGPLEKRGVPYYDPSAGGGSMLDNAGYGYGEPLNVSALAPTGLKRTIIYTFFN